VVRNADIGILHSLYNQAPKKIVLYEKQYSTRFAESQKIFSSNVNQRIIPDFKKLPHPFVKLSSSAPASLWQYARA
jgi:hypothetical protein